MYCNGLGYCAAGWLPNIGGTCFLSCWAVVNTIGNDFGMVLVKVFMFFAEASRKQTFEAEALKDPQPICMEDRIMKDGSPIKKCHMYLPSVKFKIWRYYFDMCSRQTLQPVQPKTWSHNALLTNKYKQHISTRPLQKAFAEAPRVTAEALLEKS